MGLSCRQYHSSQTRPAPALPPSRHDAVNRSAFFRLDKINYCSTSIHLIFTDIIGSIREEVSTPTYQLAFISTYYLLEFLTNNDNRPKTYSIVEFPYLGHHKFRIHEL